MSGRPFSRSRRRVASFSAFSPPRCIAPFVASRGVGHRLAQHEPTGRWRRCARWVRRRERAERCDIQRRDGGGRGIVGRRGRRKRRRHRGHGRSRCFGSRGRRRHGERGRSRRRWSLGSGDGRNGRGRRSGGCVRCGRDRGRYGRSCRCRRKRHGWYGGRRHRRLNGRHVPRGSDRDAWRNDAIHHGRRRAHVRPPRAAWLHRCDAPSGGDRLSSPRRHRCELERIDRLRQPGQTSPLPFRAGTLPATHGLPRTCCILQQGYRTPTPCHSLGCSTVAHH
jgi:hypothetical protein